MRTHPLPLDSHGARTTCLEATGPDATGPRGPDVSATARTPPSRTSDGTVPPPPLADVRAVLLTPGHQFPTGVPLHPDRRAAVVDWARAPAGSSWRTTTTASSATTASRSARSRVSTPTGSCYVGSASKSLVARRSAGVDGVARAARGRGAAAKGEREAVASVAGAADARGLHGLGGVRPACAALRQRYRVRRDRLVDAWPRARRTRVTGIAAGLHAVLELPPGTERSAVMAPRAGGASPSTASRLPAAARPSPCGAPRSSSATAPPPNTRTGRRWRRCAARWRTAASADAAPAGQQPGTATVLTAAHRLAAFGVRGNRLPSAVSWVPTVGWETVPATLATLATATVFDRLGRGGTGRPWRPGSDSRERVTRR